MGTGLSERSSRLALVVARARLRVAFRQCGGLAASACVLVLAACGGGSSENGAAVTGSASPATASDASGGTLRVASSSEFAAQDPHDYTGDFILIDMIYEPLVTYGENGVLKPALATAWHVSADGLTVRFDLRENVTFQDGTPFDAKAAKWNFDRWVGKKRHNFFATSTTIRKVEATDPSTLTLRLRKPYDPLLQELTFARPVRFLSPASVGKDGKFSKPVGTGPWRLRSSSRTTAELVRNDDYWGPQPGPERVRFTVTKDSQTRVAALRTGEVDMIGGSYLSPITPVEATGLKRDDGVALLRGRPDVTVLLGFNAQGVAGDRAVREAVRLAIDRKTLTKVLYSGLATPATTLFAPGVPNGGTPREVRFDPGEAERVLDAGGWRESGGKRSRNGTPLSLTLMISSGPVHGQQDARLSSEALADSLGKIGIEVKIKPVDEATYFDQRTAGKYDLAFFETYGAPYDPSGFVVGFLTSKVKGGLWKTPRVDELVDHALFARDAGARAQAYEAVYDVLDKDAAFVPIAYRPRFWAVRSNVKGFAVPANEYEFNLAGVTLQR